MEVKEKSLAKVEEEEKEGKQAAMATIAEVSLKAPPSPRISGQEEMPSLLPADEQIQSLPTISQQISQQQLLQANMAAIAAHASSNHNMVADLAAALRLGGTNNPSATAALTGADPRMAAAIRAAQLGSDPKNQRSFSSML